MSQYTAAGGKLITPLRLVLAALALNAGVLLAIRFIYGLASITNLNDGYTWGVWVVVDIVIGTAFACGGFAMAVLVYIFNRGRYHPLVRPALLASLFGYTLGGIAVLFDLGRYWNFWHIMWPGYGHPDSVMFEVAVCISVYILVMWIEFAPTFLERFGRPNLRRRLNKVLFVFIALGVLLPSMHQSSLGTMLVVFGNQIHDLWQTQMLPLLFLISAICMGFSIVVFEATIVAAGFKRPRETHILGKLAVVMVWTLALFLAVRFVDLMARGKLGLAFTGDFLSLMFLAETALFLVPIVILASPARRRSARLLFMSGVAMLLGGSLYRIDAFLIAFHPGENFSYFPSLPEMLVTVGIFAFEILAYMVFATYLPVFHKAAPAPHTS
ncbi:MAG: Ni/Fe-hydrogenase cytochrome b subunit [Alphaproteobacteria bacterium]|jgi:Ni/Fe-hydrogenase subunit HybB-like protein|nr:Ni/Fe-hydrogenase cytochrome b subunit [Alphaproteobacteria bacterium]